MRSTPRTILAVASLAMAATIQPAFAGCNYVNTQVVLSAFAPAEGALPPLDCYSARMTGYFNGTLLTCVDVTTFAPFAPAYGSNGDDMAHGIWYDEFRTRDGTVRMREYGVFRQSDFAQISMAIIVGGDGKYADATGKLLLSTESHVPSGNPMVRINGEICTP